MLCGFICAMNTHNIMCLEICGIFSGLYRLLIIISLFNTQTADGKKMIK